MPYNSQPSYGAAFNTQYQQQHTQYETYERPHTAGSGRNPQYQNPGRAQTQVGDFRYGNNGNELSGRRDGRGNGGWSGDGLEGEQSVIPNHSQTFVETRRDPNSSYHAASAARPYHQSPVSQFKEPQFDRHKNQEQVHLSSRQDMMQPPRFPHQELPREPNHGYEPTNIDANNYYTRNDRINPQPRTPTKPSTPSESAVDYQRGVPAMPKRQQDYAEMYRQELFHGNEGSSSGGFRTQSSRAPASDNRAQMQYSGPRQGWGKAPSRLFSS